MTKRLSTFVSLPAAGLDHHHALSSLNQNGAIAHAAALAQAFIDVGAASTEMQAIDLAHAEISRTERIAAGVLVNRMARHAIDAQASARAVARPKAVHPTSDLALNPQA
jgi:hypothetical protein